MHFFEENSVTKKIKDMKEVLRYEEVGLGGKRKIGTGRKAEKLPPSTVKRPIIKKLYKRKKCPEEKLH